MRLRILRKGKSETAAGEDSFLDIVANLVGVLIILVVVVGANAGSRIQEVSEAPVDRQALDELRQQLESTRKSAQARQQDNHQLERRIELEGRLADQRARERQIMLVQMESDRRQLEHRRATLSDEQQESLALSDRIGKLERELDKVREQLETTARTVHEKKVIEHYPTPIARTVFDDEVHFRLRGGRLVHVPMNELVDLMKNEWQETARKLDVASETLETVGPVGDFRLQYQLRSEQVTVHTGYGETTRRAPQFTRFILVPVNEAIGEPLATALAEPSRFNQRIREANPATTTISVWVYPESFAEFNELKAWLQERGYKTACWPLSRNSPISGGPSGYRSTAQ